MEERLVDILEQCLDRLDGGATVEECLASFAGQRAELEGPLRLAARLRALPRPPMPAATRVALEQSMLDTAARRRMAGTANQIAAQTVPAAPPSWRALEPAAILAGMLRALGYRGPLAQPWLRLVALALTIVLALVLSAGAFAAARAIASIVRPQPVVTPTSAPLPTPLALDGPIEQISQERWQVGGRTVILAATTAISGTPALHAVAHVRGNATPDGAVLALDIQVGPPAAAPISAPTPLPPLTSTLALTPTLPLSATVPLSSTTTLDPAMPPAAAPAPPPPPPASAPAAPPADDNQHTCNGQQRGRDDKKCDPKPKKDNNDKQNKGGKRG